MALVWEVSFNQPTHKPMYAGTWVRFRLVLQIFIVIIKYHIEDIVLSL